MELPPPPTPVSLALDGRARYPDGNDPEVRGWKKFLTIVGIIAGFNLLILPGFLGVHRYRRWKRGEVPASRVWMALGVLYLAYFVVVMVAVVIAEITGGGL